MTLNIYQTRVSELKYHKRVYNRCLFSIDRSQAGVEDGYLKSRTLGDPSLSLRLS